MSPDVSPDSVEQPTSTVAALRTALAPFGYAHVLDGLDDGADEHLIMGRLVEMGPDLAAKADLQKGRKPTKNEMDAYVAASRIVRDTAHRDVLLGRVRIYAYSDNKEESLMAHRALAHLDPVSARIVLHHEHELLESRRSGTSSQVMRIVQ